MYAVIIGTYQDIPVFQILQIVELWNYTYI